MNNLTDTATSILLMHESYPCQGAKYYCCCIRWNRLAELRKGDGGRYMPPTRQDTSHDLNKGRNSPGRDA
jgi:hypothetical protein